jgi:hypothetical protein
MILVWGVLLSIVVILMIGFQVLESYRSDRYLITPWTLYLLVAVVDIYVPGILFLVHEIPEQAPYVVPFSQEDLVVALTWFTISIPIWAIGYFSARLKWSRKTKPDPMQWNLNIRRLYVFLMLSGGWYVTYMLVDIVNNGSLVEYFLLKAQRNYGSRVEYANPAEAILFQFAPIMLTIFVMLVGMLFFLRKIYAHPFLWGVVLPVVGWLFIATTFFRGSQIVYFLALFILEWQRKKDESTFDSKAVLVDKTLRGKKTRSSMFILLLLGSVLFVSYGAIRNYSNSSSESQNNPLSVNESILLEGIRLIRGEGLIGFTRIINAYPNSVDYLLGKTYLDMMLLIIPRSIYTSKPEWYGVSDISRGLGGPDTTQDAVTVPGEAYANFGPIGISVVMIFGAMYGFFYRYKNHPRYRYAYAFIVIPSIFPLFWMSLTGLVNNMLALPFAMVVLALVVQKRHLTPQAIKMVKTGNAY